MEPAALPEATAPAPPPASWWTLGAYLGGGIGVFVLASLLLGFAARGEITLGVSALAYLINVLCLGGAAYLFGVRRQRQTWAEFGLRPFHWSWLLLAVSITLLLLPIRMAVGVVVQLAFGGMDDMQGRMAVIAPAGFSWAAFLVTLLGVGLLAPVAEEFYFRGLIHRWAMTRFGFWPRLLFSSALFALGHIDAAGVVAASFIMGLVLAAVFERSRSLWVSILIHVTNNSLAVILVYASLGLMKLFPGLGGA